MRGKEFSFVGEGRSGLALSVAFFVFLVSFYFPLSSKAINNIFYANNSGVDIDVKAQSIVGGGDHFRIINNTFGPTATPMGPTRPAEVAAKPSPENTPAPLPAIVEIVPETWSMRRTRRFPLSTM